jgi:hypothetical protein
VLFSKRDEGYYFRKFQREKDNEIKGVSKSPTQKKELNESEEDSGVV